MHQFKSAISQKQLKWRQLNFVWYERTCMAVMKQNLGFLELVDWELCLLEVGRFYGWLLAILTTVQWCQVAHRNARYVPSRYKHHILPHIGHWWPFGNNWWSTISGPSFRSFFGVDLTHLIKPSVRCATCVCKKSQRSAYPQLVLLAMQCTYYYMHSNLSQKKGIV